MKENKKYEWVDWPGSDRCDRIEHYVGEDCPLCHRRKIRQMIEREHKPTLVEKIKEYIIAKLRRY